MPHYIACAGVHGGHNSDRCISKVEPRSNISLRRTAVMVKLWQKADQCSPLPMEHAATLTDIWYRHGKCACRVKMKARVVYTHLAKLIKPTQKHERHNNVNGTDTHTHIATGMCRTGIRCDKGTQNTQGMELKQDWNSILCTQHIAQQRGASAPKLQEQRQRGRIQIFS